MKNERADRVKWESLDVYVGIGGGFNLSHISQILYQIKNWSLKGKIEKRTGGFWNIFPEIKEF